MGFPCYGRVYGGPVHRYSLCGISNPRNYWGLYAVINIILMLLAPFVHSSVAVYALMAVPFFMSIMFPTIFALGIKGLGEEAKIASSFIVMSIVGGALFPLLIGKISEVLN